MFNEFVGLSLKQGKQIIFCISALKVLICTLNFKKENEHVAFPPNVLEPLHFRGWGDRYPG